MDIQSVYDHARYANQWLGLILWFAVSFRLGMMLFDKERWRNHRALHLLAWFGWISATVFNSAFASTYYADSDVPANWTSLTRFILQMVGVVLCLWWPHPERFKRIEET